MLIGCGNMYAEPAPRYVGGTGFGDATTQTTYTTGGLAVSIEADDRFIVVFTVSVGGTQTGSSATIGGVSATKLLEQQFGTNTITAWGASVPTGTTAVISITWTGAVNGTCIAPISVYNLNSTTPNSTQAVYDAVNDATDSCTVTALNDGITLFGCAIATLNLTTTHSNLTEVHEGFDNATDAMCLGTAAKQIPAGGSTSNTVTWSGSSATKAALMLAFR